MRRAKWKRGRVRQAIGRVTRHARRLDGARRVAARRALLSVLLPVMVAGMQTSMIHADQVQSCSTPRTRSALAGAGGTVPNLTGPSHLVLRLGSGVVIAGQAVIVTATVCALWGLGSLPEAAALGIEVAGSAGSVRAAFAWRRGGL